MPRVEIIDPRVEPTWDRFVAEHPEATIFHTSAWARVLCETYNYLPQYHVLRDGSEQILAGLAVMLVESRITGRRLVGLPFSDLCPPLAKCGADASALLLALERRVQSDHLSYVEVRGACPDEADNLHFQRSSSFLRYVIPLAGPLEELKSRFHSSARRGINKAEREGVQVRIARGPEEMREFFRLHAATRRQHGLVPQPWRFFEQIEAHFISKGRGCLLFAEYRGRLIAADLLLWHRNQLFYKFNASDRRYLEVRPNNALMWEAIKIGKWLGCSSFDLGRCEVDNEGLRRFKSLWASEEMPLPSSYYPDVRGFTARLGTSNTLNRLATLMRFVPIPIMQRLGTMVYRHLA